jgi:hypothetical protein
MLSLPQRAPRPALGDSVTSGHEKRPEARPFEIKPPEKIVKYPGEIVFE